VHRPFTVEATMADNADLVRGAYEAFEKGDVQAAHVWDLRGGKAVRFQQYTDTWQIAQVTGTTPAT
jgi:ketosteroid isomerase-like protein